MRSSSSRTWASFFTKSWAFPGSGRFPVAARRLKLSNVIDLTMFRSLTNLVILFKLCWLMQLRSLTCDHHDLSKDGLVTCFRLWRTKSRENLETSACYHSCVPLHVSVGYLGLFNQLQQVFDMLSQQILALPHLIQSSESIQKGIQFWQSQVNKREQVCI